MNKRGLSVEALAAQSQKSSGTINNLLAGNAIYRTSALAIAEALGTGLDFLMADSAPSGGLSTVHEYLVADVLTDWQAASNGLKFQICRLRHLELDRYARGKRFDLRHLSTDEEQRCRTWIKRHPNVCASLASHPNIIQNITAFHDPVEQFYWVIDEWIDGESLQRKLDGTPLEQATARQLLLDIGSGLLALHEQGIVRRELNPAAVLIRRHDGRAILTEFELAKLVDRGPTVSTKDWPVDPYRAGEADSEDVDFRADVYSWSRLASHVLLGKLPEVGDEAMQLESISLPKSVHDVVVKSGSVFRSDRPSSFLEIIPLIEEWGRR